MDDRHGLFLRLPWKPCLHEHVAIHAQVISITTQFLAARIRHFDACEIVSRLFVSRGGLFKCTSRS